MLTPTRFTECNRVDILHPGDLYDGYQTFVVVDGIKLPEMNPRLYDKEIEIQATAGEPLQIVVLVLNEDKEEEVIGFLPTNFDMEIGILGIHTVSGRSPCSTTIGGFEPGVRSINVRFAEGEVVRAIIDLVLKYPKE